MKSGSPSLSSPRTLLIGITLTLILLGSGCRLTYILHAGAGQFRLLHGSVPVEVALKNDSLSPEQKERRVLLPG